MISVNITLRESPKVLYRQNRGGESQFSYSCTAYDKKSANQSSVVSLDK